MATSLMIAAGGGGDAIAAAMLAKQVLGIDQPVVMTYSWDRLIVDPLPGPRSARDFSGLNVLAEHVLEIVPDSRTLPPAGSTLPRLASELDARILLLDPADGAVGLTNQVSAAAQYFDAQELVVVDVGGDLLTTGNEIGLMSPLADLLALAACASTKLPLRVLLAGVGLDGELSELQVMERIQQLGGTHLANLQQSDVAGLNKIFEWHPSEATGMLVAAASGARGAVEVRDKGYVVHLSNESVEVFEINGRRLLRNSPARGLLKTSTLDEAADVSNRLTGRSELAYEHAKAARYADSADDKTELADLSGLDEYTAQAVKRGVDFVTIRRAGELVGVKNAASLATFRNALATSRSDRYCPPLYRVSREDKY